MLADELPLSWKAKDPVLWRLARCWPCRSQSQARRSSAISGHRARSSRAGQARKGGSEHRGGKHIQSRRRGMDGQGHEGRAQIGRENVGTAGTKAHLVCHLLLKKKK